MRTSPYILIAAILMACCGILGARAQMSVEEAVVSFDKLTRNYNIITSGNLTLNQTHTDGAVAVGGNLSLSGSDLVLKSNTLGKDPAVYVNGQITLSNESKLLAGYAYTPNLSTKTGPTYEQPNAGQRWLTNGSGGKLSFNTTDANSYIDPRNSPGPVGWDLASTNQQLVLVSAALADATATGTITFSNNKITLTTSLTSGVVIFDLDASKLANLSNTNIQIDVPADMVFVINVRNADGTTLFGGGGNNVNVGTNNDQLLWNIIADNDSKTSNTVTLGTNLYGSILAPLIDLNNGQNKYVNGQVVAGSYTQNGAEVHYVDFNAPVTFSAVPEPATYGMMGIGACAALMIWRSRRKRAA